MSEIRQYLLDGQKLESTDKLGQFEKLDNMDILKKLDNMDNFEKNWTIWTILKKLGRIYGIYKIGQYWRNEIDKSWTQLEKL